MSLVFLILISPTIIYNYNSFSPTSEELFKESNNILVNYRIPHHAIPTKWFDFTIFIKIIIISLSLIIIRKTKLFSILFPLFLFSVIAIFIQSKFSIYFLALLFPWRTSVFLVPISTSIILAYFLNYLFNSLFFRRNQKYLI